MTLKTKLLIAAAVVAAFAAVVAATVIAAVKTVIEVVFAIAGPLWGILAVLVIGGGLWWWWTTEPAAPMSDLTGRTASGDPTWHEQDRHAKPAPPPAAEAAPVVEAPKIRILPKDEPPKRGLAEAPAPLPQSRTPRFELEPQP